MKMVAGTVTPVVAAKVAGAFGLPEGAVRKAMAVGIPVILAALLKRGSTAGGMDAIAATLGGLGKNPLDAMGGPVGDAAQVSAAAESGSAMLGSLMGAGASGSLVKALAGYAGIDEKAAGPVLGLAGSAALGGLKTAADDQGLDAAGVMRLLGAQKDQINAAIPSDLGRMLGSAGVLPPAAPVKSAAPVATRVAPAPSGGKVKWAVGGLAALAALAWLGSQYFGGTTAPVTTAAIEAPAVADALVVEGLNVGESIQGVFTTLTTTLGSVTDGATAEAAAKSLTDVDATLGGLEAAIGGLSGDGKSALATLLGAGLPAIRTTVDGLLADSAIAPILKPVLDSIMSRLTSYAG
jgi:hypothetical protein